MVTTAEEEAIKLLVVLFGIDKMYLKFPDFVFFIIIPFIVSAYTVYLFLKGVGIFRGSADFINKIMAVLMVFVLLKYVYPYLFIMSVLYLTLIKKWPRSLIVRIGFWILLGVIYFWLFPYVTNLISNIS